jgi:type II secretory pathway predicted ATPase ExeA
MIHVEHHWGLLRNPFSTSPSPFVPLPTHIEAVARLRLSVENGEKITALWAPGGLGKTVVLTRALEALRTPMRRVVLVQAPTDGESLMSQLADGLGVRPPALSTRPSLWRTLTDAARLCRLQNLGLVLAIDDAQEIDDPTQIDRLTHLDTHPKSRVSVLKVGRDQPSGPPSDLWGLAIRLAPLTRSEAAEYLARKLAGAGRTEPAFTPRAIARLHLLSAGAPRGLDRLASLALMAGAMRGLEMVGPEVIENVVSECVRP